jgi:hypothetical protein
MRQQPDAFVAEAGRDKMRETVQASGGSVMDRQKKR